MTQIVAAQETTTPGVQEKRRGLALVTLAACVFPLFYLVFVVHYGRNVLQFDDWNMAPVVSHPFSWGVVWAQYGEPRLVLDRLVFLADGLFGTLDLRRILVFTAVMWILGYGGALLLFHRYLARRLTIPAVLAIGAVWFSLADVQNALFAFQVGWFLVVVGLIGMMLALLVPRANPYLWVSVGVGAAFFGTMAWIQGFVLWPLGLVCILWAPRTKATLRCAALWVTAFAVVTITYAIGYNTAITSCQPATGCVKESAITHPVQAARFLLAMLGNVVPGRYLSGQPFHIGITGPQSLVRFELLGVVVLVAAAWVVIGSVRARGTTDRLPIPLVLVLFGLLVDLTIVWGRVGSTPSSAVLGNRYVMPNLVLLVGIVMYAWAHARPTSASRLIVGVLACFLVFQFAWSTAFGISSARDTDAFLNASARVVVNLDHYPKSQRTCAIFTFLIPEGPLATARANHLGEFSQIRYYRQQGPPALHPPC